MDANAGRTIQSVYRDIADLTMGHCKANCRIIGSCCSPEYCEMAVDIAHEVFNVTLVPGTGRIPLLDDAGKCMAEPHFRPLCSRHSCDINSLGVFKNDLPLTQRYFRLVEVAEGLDKVYAKNGVTGNEIF